MKKTRIMLFYLFLFIGLAIGATNSEAYQKYSGSNSCSQCHSGFIGKGPSHTQHLKLTSNCTLCHIKNGDNPLIAKCAGCHAGPGLRAHHKNAGAPLDVTGLTCAACHPGDPTPDPESILPPYYSRTDVMVKRPCQAQPAPPGEDFSGNGKGIDNDGDLLYDAADPDCAPPPTTTTTSVRPTTTTSVLPTTTTTSVRPTTTTSVLPTTTTTSIRPTTTTSVLPTTTTTSVQPTTTTSVLPTTTTTSVRPTTTTSVLPTTTTTSVQPTTTTSVLPTTTTTSVQPTTTTSVLPTTTTTTVQDTTTTVQDSSFTWNQNCNQCHTPDSLHALATHNNCSSCHNGSPGPDTVLPSKCTACHGEACTIVNKHANKNTCLSCHNECAPADSTTTVIPSATSTVTPSTTTTMPATTTTTVPSQTTTTALPDTHTTTIPQGPCLTVEPDEVTVNRLNKLTTDIVVTIENTDLIDAGLTEKDLAKLNVSFDGECASYITINAVNYATVDNKPQATVNITVADDAPASTCTLRLSDPIGIVSHPIECAAEFVIKSNIDQCEIESINPTSVRIGFGLIPRIKKIAMTVNVDLEAIGITEDDLTIENAPKGVHILSANVVGNKIEVIVLFWGVKSGAYNLKLGSCNPIPFVISQF